MNENLLTIAIPTFNRAKLLEGQLRRLAKQAGIDAVHVLVSNNGSNDSTEEVALKCKRLFKNFQYHVNDQNLGFDANIQTLYALSKTKYVWFLSDDDKVTDAGITRILNALRDYEPAVLYPNVVMAGGEAFLKNGDMVDIAPYYPAGIAARVLTETPYDVVSDVARLVHSRLCSFISACIVRKSDSLQDQLKQFIGTGILQDSILSLTLISNPKFYAMADPCVIGGEKDSFSRWFMESGLFGVFRCYSQRELRYPHMLYNRLTIQTCKFILSILKNRKSLGLPIHYSLDIRESFKILLFHKWRTLYFLRALLSTLRQIWREN